MGLVDEIAAIRAAKGDPATLVGEFRRTAVLVPTVDEGLLSGVLGGIRWVYAFTDEPALARFTATRGDGAPGREGTYRHVLGARLLDSVIPQLDGPAGVAVNIADEHGSMLFPPVRGIVPDAVAVDREVVDQDRDPVAAHGEGER
ncbi:hypothetical protein ACZ90_52775 [Streptomyces albus subsp. albus]|nr:hypothetical protein ACZ90_52775 [Streptomyces albus subsp. albus]